MKWTLLLQKRVTENDYFPGTGAPPFFAAVFVAGMPGRPLAGLAA